MELNRVVKLRAAMEERGVDVALISPGPNLRYLAGFDIDPHERTFLMVISERGLAFVAPKLEEEKVLDRTAETGAQVFAYKDEEGPDRALKGAIDSAEAVKPGSKMVIGAEYLHMRVKEFEMVRSVVGEFEAYDADGLMMALRVIKDEQEIQMLRKAACIVDVGIEAARRAIMPGVTERRVAEAIERSMMEAGADSVPFNSVLSGPKAALPHGETGDRMIEEGEFVLCDIGACYMGYNGDITRTIAVSRPSGEMLALYDAVAEANEAGRMAARPGITSEELDCICRDVISRRGFADLFIHRTGHGLGVEIHEEPYIVKGSQTTLLPGMAFTIEPGAYLPGVGGVRIEDDVIITPLGAEVLTKSHRRP
ncbi:MAG TPA: Xaa-Pro peptidase family protein [Bacillota bacterium]|nr:Xaa-Pro peptidase family protein [Bacillota bacterium]HOH09540.1 Xaa-Pro peptidase family protein [Bacillota bacterium]